MTRLVGTGRVGDFVHQTQQMGTQEGFRNVSKHWLDTGTMSYADAVHEIEKGRAEIEDFRAPFVRFTPTVTNDGRFVMRMHDGLDYTPTPFCLKKHLAPLAGISSWQAESLMTPVVNRQGKQVRGRDAADATVLRDLLLNGLRDFPQSKRMLFRTQKDGTLRAVLSLEYATLDNIWFLETLSSILPGGRVSHWRNDGDFSTLWSNVLIPDKIRKEQDSDYGGMVSIGNSEIGRRRLSCIPSIFRAICMNGCIHDQVEGVAFKQIHRGSKLHTTLREQLKLHINRQIPLIDQAIDSLLATRQIAWDGASVKPVFANLAMRFSLSPRQATDVLDAWREESEVAPDLKKTAFAVINAVTRSGRKSSDPETWVARDELGGKLLDMDPKRWKRFFHEASELSAKEVDKSFVFSNN